MSGVESELRGKQEQILVIAAREALDRQRPEDALSLIERLSVFWSQALVVSISVHVYQARESYLKGWALRLFYKQLDFCEAPTRLIDPFRWITNPVRKKDIPDEFEAAICARRKTLEPDWTGNWEDPNKNSAVFTTLTKRPEEISDPIACLVAASQTREWNPWFARYRALGGSFDDPRYLKIRIARAVTKTKEPSEEIRVMLRKYLQVGHVGEVRSFLQKITAPTFHGVKTNRSLAKFALLLYCGWGRLEHMTDDWVHVARCAQYLNHEMILRIAQRGLAEMERTPSAHRVFEELNSRYGEVRVSHDPKTDIGLKGNPIWQSVYHQLPVNANAVRILTAYSRSELETS